MSSDAAMDEIRQQKADLRKEVRSRLRALSAQDIQTQSAQVWERLFDLDEYQQARSVGLFLSMPKGEICTDTVLMHAIKNGKTVYIPQVGECFEKCDMDLLRVVLPEQQDANNQSQEQTKLFHHDWPRNKWGIPEPPPDIPQESAMPGDIDLLVVPGLAFDNVGGRMGQGKGYYDRFIAKMRTSPDGKPLLVAVALEPQLVDQIPVHPHDFRMDMAIFPNQTMTFMPPLP